MVVLSLFDGMSCGQIALRELVITDLDFMRNIKISIFSIYGCITNDS
jgi:hypothetical protein